MGYLLIDDEKATNSRVSTNAPSTLLSEKATITKNVCKTQSRLNDVSMFVSQPAEMDVLCGQDKNFTQHPGNKLYRSVIASWSERYGQTVNKQSKMRMTTEICKYMKKKYNTRFLKPTPIFMEEVVSISEGTSLVAFRWQVLKDQAARDKISHALRTSVTASRKREERRKKMKLAEQKNQKKRQSTYSKMQENQSQHAKLEVDELWVTSPNSLHDSMQSFAAIPEPPPSHGWYGESYSSASLHDSMQSFAAIPEPPPSHGWYGESYSSAIYKYEPNSFNSSAGTNSSCDASAWHDDANWDDLETVEPLPLSSGVSFTFSSELAASLSHLLFDDSD